MTNVVQFSDAQAAKKRERVNLLVALDSGKDDQGNIVLNADLGPLEVSLYTSRDGSLVVQIDHTTLTESEKPSLRVYLNDTTLYDPEIESDADSITLEGA